MFYRGYSILTALARAEGLPSPRATGEAVPAAEASARASMAVPIGDMPLSKRLSDPDAYRALQRARRDCLEALLPIEADEAALRRAVDLICAVCEESRWSENAARAPFDDDAHPDIDFQCAETLMLLGWTARALGDRLTSRVAGKLVYEARRRVFSPFLAHEDYPFMRGRGRRPLCILCDILLSAILLETSEQRRSAIMKQALRLIDQAIGTRADAVESLEDAAAETGAVTDLAALLRRLTRDRLDLTPEYPTPDWLDGLLYPWLEGEWFCDPAGAGMLPQVSGAELFRIGLAANDDALTALGASLHRARAIPSATLTGRLMDMGCRAALEAEGRKPPRIKCGATPRNRVMVSRFSGMTCALHTGGRRANAGGVMLFCDGQPILVEAPGHPNLPTVGGREQLDAPDLACEADFSPRPDRDTLSVELTHAWPAGLFRTCQRTAIVQRPDAALRLVDALDLAEPAVFRFRFHTPVHPEPLTGGLRLGGVDFTWEGELTAKVGPVPDAEGLYRIELTTPAPVGRAFYTFNFIRNDT